MIWSGPVHIVSTLILKINLAYILHAKTVIMIFVFCVLVKGTHLYTMDSNIIDYNANFYIIMMIQKKKFQKITKNARSLVENKSVKGPKIWWIDSFQKNNGQMNNI